MILLIRSSFAIFLALIACVRSEMNSINEIFSWKIVDFDFHDDQARKEAIKNRIFIPENNQPLGIERWKDKLFVSLPPWREGVVATLAYIDLSKTKGNKSPKLKPYPDWQTHDLRNTSMGAQKLANVVRMNVDRCDRLWLADRGLVNIMGTRDQIHNPKIQIYDLKTDKVVRAYNISRDMVNDYSFFGSIIADVSPDDCSKAYAYVSDLRANAIFVYSYELNDIWRVEHHYFHFDPLHGDYVVGNVEFQWTDGIIGISLSPPQHDGYRTLYFCPMSSSKLFAVSTRVIQNRTLDWSGWNNTEVFHRFRIVGDRGPFMQSTTSTIDEKTGVMFFTLLCQDSIACWNTKNEYTLETRWCIARDREKLSYPNDMKVDKNGILWITSNRLHEFIFTGQNFSDINFRIFTVSVADVITGTPCGREFEII